MRKYIFRVNWMKWISIYTKKKVVIGEDFNGHFGEGNMGEKEVMGRYAVKEKNLEGQVVVDFAKRMEIAVINTNLKKTTG